MYVAGPVGNAAVEEELRKLARELSKVQAGKLLVATRAPAKPEDGDVVVCDGVNWNPLSDGVKRPLWYDRTTQTWKKFE